MAARITVVSYEELQAADDGAVMSVTVSSAMPISDALAVRDRIRALGWVLVNPSLVEDKIHRASTAKGEVAAYHGISNTMLARADRVARKLNVRAVVQ